MAVLSNRIVLKPVLVWCGVIIGYCRSGCWRSRCEVRSVNRDMIPCVSLSSVERGVFDELIRSKFPISWSCRRDSEQACVVCVCDLVRKLANSCDLNAMCALPSVVGWYAVLGSIFVRKVEFWHVHVGGVVGLYLLHISFL